MKNLIKLLISLILSLHALHAVANDFPRPRVLILTDIENEPDDAQSLVRYLLYSNQFDTEGIVATTSCWQRDEIADWRIYEILDAYEKVQSNLLMHEPGYPETRELRKLVKRGYPGFGMEAVGSGKESGGNNLLKCETPPRVFVFTDINIDSGDPDDRQSLIHLLWYADELEIEGVVPDRWSAKAYEACQMVAEAYSKDYTEYQFEEKGYPQPEKIGNLFATDRKDAINRFREAASIEESPLYVLIWGNMELFGEALGSKPEAYKNIRVITIGTDLMIEAHRKHMPKNWEKTEKPCEQYNWNGRGRNEIFRDERFKDMWWLEINWTYEGMFSGEEPKEMFHKLLEFGAMGKHMEEVVKNQAWARYFRVGDTPSVLYVIDPGHNLNDPTRSSWAGKFTQPFPQKRPNYFTDFSGNIDWNYSNPCETWHNHLAVRDHAKSTLESRRQEMYDALLDKLRWIYSR